MDEFTKTDVSKQNERLKSEQEHKEHIEMVKKAINDINERLNKLYPDRQKDSVEITNNLPRLRK